MILARVHNCVQITQMTGFWLTACQNDVILTTQEKTHMNAYQKMFAAYIMQTMCQGLDTLFEE
jgi:hypothetical protein